MIEPIMYLAIGFMISMLLGLMIVPLVHNRAVRLTTRRLEAATPLSMAEIQADKDQLRAEFAMSARRLEMSVDQLKNKTTSQLAELGKKSDAINRLKIEIGEKSTTIFALEAREQAMKRQLDATVEDVATKTKALQGAGQALTEARQKIEDLSAALADRTTTAEGRATALAAMTTRSREFEQQVLTQTTNAETLTRRVADLEARLANQIKLAAAHERENDVLRQQIEATQLRRDAAGEPQSPAPQSERMENAVLRERISDIAAEVAKLASTLEGADSPIKAILANSPAGTRGGATLADRIRALQSQVGQR
jgi:chromosome segregation ATPase